MMNHYYIRELLKLEFALIESYGARPDALKAGDRLPYLACHAKK